jgi:NAD(P)-dependent dehydrogenase (short-subunit alcohol dehydrogenase family)
LWRERGGGSSSEYLICDCPQETKKVVEEAGRRCVLLPGDLATEAGCQAAVKGAVDALGRIDILVSVGPLF